MNKITARTMMISILAAMAYNAANAAVGSSSNDPSVMKDPSKYVVRFSDLDLSRIDGATTLYDRIRRAARMVCDPLDSREIGLAEKYRACVDKAVADAVVNVNRPLLSRYHQLHTKGSDRVGTTQLATAN